MPLYKKNEIKPKYFKNNKLQERKVINCTELLYETMEHQIMIFDPTKSNEERCFYKQCEGLVNFHIKYITNYIVCF